MQTKGYTITIKYNGYEIASGRVDTLKPVALTKAITNIIDKQIPQENHRREQSPRQWLITEAVKYARNTGREGYISNETAHLIIEEALYGAGKSGRVEVIPYYTDMSERSFDHLIKDFKKGWCDEHTPATIDQNAKLRPVTTK